MRKGIVVVMMLGMLGARPVLADSGYMSEAGFGLLATVANIPYMPVKILYAGIGSFVGALGYVVTAGDVETGRGVWAPTLGGSYVLTGEMLRGEQPILFVGPSYQRPCEPRQIR